MARFIIATWTTATAPLVMASVVGITFDEPLLPAISAIIALVLTALGAIGFGAFLPIYLQRERLRNEALQQQLERMHNQTLPR